MENNLPADTKPATSAPEPGNAPAKSGTPERTFTQAELETILAERLKRAEQKHAEATAKRDQEAAEKAAKEQGEWRKLAEDYEPQAKRAQALDAFIAELLEGEIAGVPEKVKSLVPEGDALARLKWVRTAKAAGIFAPASQPHTDADSGTGPQQPARGQLSQEARQELAARYGVNPKYMPEVLT